LNITHEMNMHNCQLCKKEWLGRCFGKKYGKDVSVDNEPCKCYKFGGSKERLKEIENNMKWRFQKEDEIMNQSNYEKYAVIKQQELLHKERNLQQAISCLRDRRKFASLQSIDSAIDFVADLYGLSIDEIKRAIDGEEYWCV